MSFESFQRIFPQICKKNISMWTKGAHLAGLAAKKVRTGKIGAIIGLDPASIGFSANDAKNRLAKSDAAYVQVIHTNTRLYGMEEPIGS